MEEKLTTETVASESQSIKVACLRVGDGFYALDIMCIKEIIRPLPIVSVPKSPLYIDGVVNLRKAVIPVVDLRRRFGFADGCVDKQKNRIVICSIDGRIVGLLADEVTEVLSCREVDIRPTPYYLSGPEAELFPCVCRKGEDLMLLLDLRKLLSSDKQIDMANLSLQASVSEDQ